MVGAVTVVPSGAATRAKTYQPASAMPHAPYSETSETYTGTPTASTAPPEATSPVESRDETRPSAPCPAMASSAAAMRWPSSWPMGTM